MMPIPSRKHEKYRTNKVLEIVREICKITLQFIMLYVRNQHKVFLMETC